MKEFNLLYVVIVTCAFLYSHWYCCVDVSVSRQMLVTGDNVGQLLLLSMDGQKVFHTGLNILMHRYDLFF